MFAARKYSKLFFQNQFHDILPGTCITPVNENTKKETAKIILDAESETEKYLNKLTDGSENCITVLIHCLLQETTM